MSALVVDTSSWISYFQSGAGAAVIDDALKEGRVYLPPLVAAELASGNVTGAKRNALLDFIRELPLISCDLDHWLRVGELRLKAAKRGLSLSTPDAHVAQCSVDISGRLLSEDKVFKRLSSLVPSVSVES